MNTKILANIVLNEHNNLPLKQAEGLGAIMLFGEKYNYDLIGFIKTALNKKLIGDDKGGLYLFDRDIMNMTPKKN